MKLDDLKEDVWAANIELVKRGLVSGTWGNVSGIDRDGGLVVIKPSGVPYGELAPSNLAVVRLDGTREAGPKPSSDTPTHLTLYRAFPKAGGVAHTHSRYATSWAQARRPIPCLGTTHADHFHGEVPLTGDLTPEEIAGDYEAETGAVIVRAFASLDPARIPAVLVAGHGPFTWGPSASAAVENASVLEEVARMALYTLTLNPSAAPISQDLLDKHFLRKHGPDAYYGQ